MRIACRQCQSLYDVPDEKLARGAVKLRCTQCQHVFVVKKKTAVAPPASAPLPPPQPAPALPIEEGPGEARFEDFDFGLFDSPSAADEAAPAAPPPSEAQATSAPDLSDLGDPTGLDDLDLPSLGELDLGEFGDTEGDLDLRESAPTPPPAEPQAGGFERVRQEDLVAPAARAREPAQGAGGEVPRLDLQKGPRRGEAPQAPLPLAARDQRRSPLFWVVLLAALGSAGYTAFNVYRHPEALTFFSPARITALLTSRRAEAQFGVEGLQGYYRSLGGGRRVFLIRGEVANRTGKPQGVLRVRGMLFGNDGRELASAAAYCGNVLSDAELNSLSLKAVQERLDNEVGEGLSNVDVAPSAKVPFMIVFPSPPDGVQKFDVSVFAGKPG